jgi:hypothetical protein
MHRRVGLEDFCMRKDEHYHLGAKITVLFAIEPGGPRLPPHVCGCVQCPQHWLRWVHSIDMTINILRNFSDQISSEVVLCPLLP